MSSKVSVIVPAFNAELYIGTFIQSIQNQTYDNWELIIVDDISKDSTFSIISKYAQKDSRIIAVQRNRAPKGSVTCRNIGQSMATGDYIIHFDADDIVKKFCLEQRVEFMEDNPNIEYATFKGASVYEKDGKLVYEGRYWGNDPHKDLLSCFLSVNYPFSVWNNIYRADIFKNILWDEKVKIYTDFSYIVPVLISKRKHIFFEKAKIDYLYRVNMPGAMTSNFIADEKYQSTIYLFDKTMKQIEQLSSFRKYKKNFKRYYLLQFERLLISGTMEQIENFIKYYSNYYKDSFKLHIIYLSLRKDICNGRKKIFKRKVHLLIYSICLQKELLKWIIGVTRK